MKNFTRHDALLVEMSEKFIYVSALRYVIGMPYPGPYVSVLLQLCCLVVDVRRVSEQGIGS
jgi:hypothetical protein